MHADAVLLILAAKKEKGFLSSLSSCEPRFWFWSTGTQTSHQQWLELKAAYSVTFDLFILEIMFLFFKNTVKILKFRYTFYLFRNN